MSADLVPESDEQLLAQCDVETFRSGGPGGQHANTTESAVRLTHRPTGIVVTCRDERSQYQNKMNCLRRLRERIEESRREPAKRIPTRAPQIAKTRRLEAKKRRSRVKRERTHPDEFDE